MTEPRILPTPSPKIPSLALIPYYGSAPLAHHLAVKDSGVRVLRTDGDACIDSARSVLLEHAFRLTEIEVAVFIDSDMAFTRKDYDAIALSAHQLDAVVGGACVTKGDHGATPRLSGQFKEIPKDPVRFYEQGGLYSATRLGMAFTAISRKAYERLVTHSGLGKVWMPLGDAGGTRVVPLFLPMIRGDQYLKEDYAFSARALAAGVPLYLDTRPDLVHYGQIGFRIEDLARPPTQKNPDFGFTVTPKP
jgi:hypothetical protein